MRQPKTLKYLFDIAEGCRLLDQFTAGKALAELISNSSRIIAFRNRLIHGYAGVLSDVVWGILETHLPTLRSEVAKLLEGPAK